jgi:hypothetical protein
MKPKLSRKATSAARINLNRFWNELEDFYARQDESKFELPAYTTDVFDHEREAAENEANERLERTNSCTSCVDEDEELELIQSAADASLEKGHTRMLVSNKHASMSDVARQTLRDRLQSQDILDLDYLDEDDDDACSFASSSSSRCASPQLLALWNVLEASPLPSPPPPKSLVDIVSIVAQRLA